jgi:orotate phosphoribosyltransferase
VKFSSCSAFISQATKALEEDTDAELEIEIDSSASLLDFYTLGRLLAFLEDVWNTRRIRSRLAFPLTTERSLRLKHLDNLGFFNYCADRPHIDHNVEWPFPDKHRQQELITFADAILAKKTYWYCLLPLTEVSVEAAKTEEDIDRQVRRHLRSISETVMARLPDIGLTFGQIGLEVSRILYTCFREMISNAVTHSGAATFTCGMSISRETGLSQRQSRERQLGQAGVHKYDVLVMDTGRGVYSSVRNTFDRELPNPAQGYLTSHAWEPDYRVDHELEASVLTSLFQSDNILRSGRRSEGLHEVARTLEWFAGRMSYRTGRTAVVVSAEGRDLAVDRISARDQRYYLPGVVASFVLPSNQLKVAALQEQAKLVPDSATSMATAKVTQVVHTAIREAPSGLFGAGSRMRIRRQSQLNAAEIECWFESREDSSEVLEIDLQLSPGIDLEFFDSLLQELCKRGATGTRQGSGESVSRIVFTNVPRQVIKKLESGSAASLMMLRGVFALMLDETDAPHFVGLPRPTENSNDIDECANLVWASGRVSVHHLDKILGPDPAVVEQLVGTLRRHSCFGVEGSGGAVVLSRIAVVEAIRKRRQHALRGVEDFELPTGKDEVFRLHNGKTVNSLLDYALFWSTRGHALDCAKEMIAVAPFPPTDTIIAFMNNGERIAGEVQRFTNAASLIIVNPARPDQWPNLDAASDCILVIDAIHCGDDEPGDTAYVRRFIEEYDDARDSNNRMDSGSRDSTRIAVRGVYCMVNHTIGTPEPITEIAGHKIHHLIGDIPVGPTPSPPEITTNALREGEHFLRLKPTPRGAVGDAGSLSSAKHRTLRSPEFTPIELSTEFWHNVSELKIVSQSHTGREERSVLFYENNERILQHPRTRRYLQAMIGEYVRNTLDLKVDVILHPTHPVGAYLSQVIASFLTHPPMIYPLTQRRYGGSIELTEADYRYFEDLTEAARDKGREMRTVIVDDSVLSGGSLFTMLGIASKLHLQVVGTYVLLNRLTAEVSDALHQIAPNFAYLYRLHMPLLKEDDSPDQVLRRISSCVHDDATSHFCIRTCDTLLGEESHFLAGDAEIDENTPPQVDGLRIEPEDELVIERFKLEHILGQLILHPETRILDRYTRVAIAYNFLGKLAYCKSFWNMLDDMASVLGECARSSQNAFFLRKIIYIAAFSRHTYPRLNYVRLQALCESIVNSCFESKAWIEHKSVVAECLMSLGIVGSERIVSLSCQHGPAIAQLAMDDTISIDEREAARDVAGALAWGLGALRTRKELLPGTQLSVCASVPRERTSARYLGDLLLIDMLETSLEELESLRTSLGIEPSTAADRLLDVIGIPARGTSAFNFLAGAPGYTCTLKCILELCTADTVLLYAKNETDQDYLLWSFETRHEKQPMDELTPDDLKHTVFPSPTTRKHIEDGVFFVADSDGDCGALNRFSRDTKHSWCFGARVHTRKGPSSYYVVVGYSRLRLNRTRLNTAYYYWLKYERVIREILPSVYNRYFISSSAWNALVQSFRAVHARQLTVEPGRGTILRFAMGSLDPRGLMQRAVRMSREPITETAGVNKQVEECQRDLQQAVESVCREIEKMTGVQLMPGLVPNMSVEKAFAGTRTDVPELFSLPKEVLEFILYESICNAYSHGATELRLETEVKRVDPDAKARDIRVVVRIRNDLPEEASTRIPALVAKGTGREACRAAARAVGGDYKSEPTESGKLWESEITLYGYGLPEDLRECLGPLLA